MDELHEKLHRLEGRLRELGRVAVAYSSGVDSTFLLKVAHDALGEGALALTVRSVLNPAREMEEARDFCRREGISQVFVEAEPLALEGFAENPPDRCYLCKRDLMGRCLRAARERGFVQLLEGSNLDDLGDYRPGLAALGELGVLSPLREAGLGKEEIRTLSRELGLATWDKPSFACLASRFAYGETITREALERVERGEELLWAMGLRQFRLRVHGQLSRLEVLPGDFPRLLERREELVASLRRLGFLYVTLDLQGFESGSMNRSICSEPTVLNR